MRARKAGLEEGRKPWALLYKHLQSVVDNAISYGHVHCVFESHGDTISSRESASVD